MSSPGSSLTGALSSAAITLLIAIAPKTAAAASVQGDLAAR
jgi:hypothetical protein